jgi:hypothetical protein
MQTDDSQLQEPAMQHCEHWKQSPVMLGMANSVCNRFSFHALDLCTLPTDRTTTALTDTSVE